jgi:hypothetical protein
LTFETPGSPVVLDQQGCRFVPHVFGLQTGQTLMILNSDPTWHNVHPTPRINAEWNQSHMKDAPPMLKKFPRPELMISIKCNQHPWMRAYVGVMSHPFFAVTDSAGAYQIEGIPPGSYTVVAWHEKLGELTAEITVAPNGHITQDFSFQ